MELDSADSTERRWLVAFKRIRSVAQDSIVRLWEMDGGFCDQHQVMLDDDGELWGWENVQPREKMAIQRALVGGVSCWYTYTIKELSMNNCGGKDG